MQHIRILLYTIDIIIIIFVVFSVIIFIGQVLDLIVRVLISIRVLVKSKKDNITLL